YQYMGPTLTGGATLNLNTLDYTVYGLWKEATPRTLLLPGVNISESNAMAIGGLVVRNDVRGDVESYIHHATVGAGSVTVTALEHAAIASVLDSAVTASGGSAFGTGDQLA